MSQPLILPSIPHTNTSMYIHLHIIYTMYTIVYTYMYRERERHTHNSTTGIQVESTQKDRMDNRYTKSVSSQIGETDLEVSERVKQFMSYLLCFCFFSFRLSANSKVPSWGRWMSSE